MKRINAILVHPKYQEYLKKNKIAEKNRIFCHHDLQHALDVARIAYILSLEKHFNFSKEVIYATALLHDIGRFVEYNEGIDHAQVSSKLCIDILTDCGFTQEEKKIIVSGIKGHRTKNHGPDSFEKLVYDSDKLSRPCHQCLAIKDCKWFVDKHKPTISY